MNVDRRVKHEDVQRVMSDKEIIVLARLHRALYNNKGDVAAASVMMCPQHKAYVSLYSTCPQYKVYVSREDRNLVGVSDVSVTCVGVRSEL